MTEPPLTRRALAEFVGTALLVLIVVGSGIMAQELSPGNVGLQLLENSTATVFGLGVLIAILGPVSGAHFNPVVTLADWWHHRQLTRAALGSYVLSQVLGGITGAIVANVMFAKPAITWSTHERSAGHLLLGEVVATAGLILVIFCLARASRLSAAPVAVASYIGAAYWFTSSTSFANPAVTVGRAFSDTFAGITPASVPGFIAAQLVGGVIGLALVRGLYGPVTTESLSSAIPSHDSADAHIPDRTHTSGASSMDTEPDDVYDAETDPLLTRMSAQPATRKPSVLFVCVHNAGRSQMAAGWLTHLAGDRIEVRSAGSAPADTVNPVAVEAMKEVGIDITAETPKILTTEAVEESDAVITMGCGDVCPIFPGKRYEDWKLDDPAGQGIEAVRLIRDEIRDRIKKLIAELDAASCWSASALQETPEGKSQVWLI